MVLVAGGCGKEAPPQPPEIRVAERTTDLTAYQEGEVAVLRWSYPTTTTAGQTLPALEAIEVWRATMTKSQEPPPPVTPQDRALQRQLLEAQGEVAQRLEPAEIEAATRGSMLVYRDDLEPWLASATDDTDSVVVWYAVRTICCRKKESDLSNVARLLPTAPPAPPEGLQLTAGAEGIKVQWVAVPEIKVLVERSADGTMWTTVTEQPVAGDEWLDTGAEQGRAWIYRLRSVVEVQGGARVVGDPSDPVRIEHPDTYAPATPEEVVCLPEGAEVRIRWRLVAGAASYEVVRRAEGGPEEALASGLKAVEFVDREPPLGRIVYLVVAVDEAGNTSDAASCSVVMGAVP